MRIQSITLTNYRLYRGVNQISFPADSTGKNVYLISGENGFGKTTFLHSLLWCLYGRMMADVDDSLRKEISNSNGYNTFLIRNLNNTAYQYVSQVGADVLARIKKTGYTNDDSDILANAVYSVAIYFTGVNIPSVPCRTLTIVRSYDMIKTEEKIEILIDGQKSELTLSIGDDIFINDFVLSKDVARFFFFDSERIVALAETNTLEERRRLTSAYNEVLGVKKYEDLKHNIEALRIKFRKRTSDIVSRNKLMDLLSEREKMQADSETLGQVISEKETELESLRQKDNEVQEKLLREGQGMTMNEFNKQKLILESARSKEATIKAQLRSFLEYAPFAIVGKLMKNTIDEITKDYTIEKNIQNAANQNDLLQNIYVRLSETLIPIVGDKNDEIKNVIRDILKDFQEEVYVGTPLLHISQKKYDDCLAIYANLTSTYRVEFEHLTEDNKKNKQLIGRVQQRLSSVQASESDEIIKQIRIQKDVIESQIKDLESELKSLYAQQGIVSQNLVLCKKHITDLAKKVSLDSSDSQKDILSEQLIDELEVFLHDLKIEKKNSLEQRLKNILNTLMHKVDFVGNVSVKVREDGCIDIDLYTSMGTLIAKDSLSKGEQQLYATSLLKALVEESKIEFPVFIDSPLQKFDKSHSNRIITEFYPTISKQVVLFPLLHKELTESEFEMMRPLVKATYLIRNDAEHSYFQTVPVDNFMSN